MCSLGTSELVCHKTVCFCKTELSGISVSYKAKIGFSVDFHSYILKALTSDYTVLSYSVIYSIFPCPKSSSSESLK